MEVPLGDTYYFKFTTRQFSDGVPTTLAGTPAISVYEENNLTQITAGITLTADYDSVTGLNDVAIVATGANGYEAGKYYDAVITTGTVGGTSVVGEVVKHFRIVPAEDAGAGIRDVNVTHVSDVAEDIATETKQDTAQTDLDTITGSDGVTLATAQALYAPAKAGDSMALAAGAITNASLAGNMEIVFETDFATNYNATRNAWVTNAQDFVGTTASDPFNGQVVAASVTAGVTLANGAVTDASLAGNMEIVFETDFATNYNATRNAWVTNAQDFVGTTAADPFNGQVVAASVTGAVGSVTGAVGSVSGNVDGNVTGSVGSNLELGPSEVNAEVLDVLNTDTFAEPGQGTPGATVSLAAKIGYLYKAWRNRSTQTATQYSLYADDATTVDQKATVSDDGTTADKGEVATGP